MAASGLTPAARPPWVRRPSRASALVGAPPDVAFVHELDLPVDDLAAVLRVGVRGAVQVEVLGVDRLFVDELVLLGGQVLDPVVPLRAGPELAQRLDVDGARHPRGPAAVVVPADD